MGRHNHFKIGSYVTKPPNDVMGCTRSSRSFHFPQVVSNFRLLLHLNNRFAYFAKLSGFCLLEIARTCLGFYLGANEKYYRSEKSALCVLCDVSLSEDKEEKEMKRNGLKLFQRWRCRSSLQNLVSRETRFFYVFGRGRRPA